MVLMSPGFEVLGVVDGADVLRRIEEAGRTCYKSGDAITEDSARAFVRKIIDRGHESVIEHISVSVRIICDRGILAEITRHRLASYSVESTRFVNYSYDKFGSGIPFILPLYFPVDSEMFGIWRRACEDAETSYMNLIHLGAKPEEARAVLPNSLQTEIVMTCNLREWRHFFKLRTACAAHPQMRQIAVPMLEKFKELIPVVFDDIVVEETLS